MPFSFRPHTFTQILCLYAVFCYLSGEEKEELQNIRWSVFVAEQDEKLASPCFPFPIRFCRRWWWDDGEKEQTGKNKLRNERRKNDLLAKLYKLSV